MNVQQIMAAVHQMQNVQIHLEVLVVLVKLVIMEMAQLVMVMIFYLFIEMD